MNGQIHQHHVVIIGGGFGGLYAARQLMHSPVRATLLDMRNFHLFQPLLYQVATGSLSPGDIAYPLRWIVSRAKNIEVLAGEAVDILPEERRVILKDDELSYDSLIIAAGVAPYYFGRPEWENSLLGLKTIEDALEIRRQILLAFEAAEREKDPARRSAWLHFVIVGGGPTGVELAGAIAELAKETMRGEFRRIDPGLTQITLLEGTDRVLNEYPEELSLEAQRALNRKGVTVRTGALFVNSANGLVTFASSNGEQEQIAARTVLWAAGIRASPLAETLARRCGASLDRIGRVIVDPDLTVPGYPNLFVIGDMAHFAHQTGSALPGVAQVAIQQGTYSARLVLNRLKGRESPPFRYQDKGSMAVIGRNAAVADLGRLHLGGFPGWVIWAFIHISFLIGFDNKLLVLIRWAWYYLTHKRGTRLITGDPPYPLI